MAPKTPKQRIVRDPDSLITATFPRSPLPATHSSHRRREPTTPDHKTRRTSISSRFRTPDSASHRSSLPSTHSAHRRRATATSDRKTRRTSVSPRFQTPVPASYRSPPPATHSADRRRATTTSDHKARRTSVTSHTPDTASPPRRSAISAPAHHRSNKVKKDHCDTSYEGYQRFSNVRRGIFLDPAEVVNVPEVKGDHTEASFERHQTAERPLYPAKVISAPEVKGDHTEASFERRRTAERPLYPAKVISAPEASRFFSYMAPGWASPVDLPLPPWPLSIPFSSRMRSALKNLTNKFEFDVLDENVISVWREYYKTKGLERDERAQLSGNLAAHMNGKSVGSTLEIMIHNPRRRNEELGEFLRLLGMFYTVVMDLKDSDFQIRSRRCIKYHRGYFYGFS